MRFGGGSIGKQMFVAVQGHAGRENLVECELGRFCRFVSLVVVCVFAEAHNREVTTQRRCIYGIVWAIVRRNIPVSLKVLIRTSSGCGLWRGFIMLRYYLLMVDLSSVVCFLSVTPLLSSALSDSKKIFTSPPMFAGISRIRHAIR